MTKNLTFDNEMKSLSLGVYKDNKNSIPKDWVRFSERDNESTGFHAETFYKKVQLLSLCVEPTLFHIKILF